MSDSPVEHTPPPAGPSDAGQGELEAEPSTALARERAEQRFWPLVRAAARDRATHAQFLATLDDYGFSAEQRLTFLRLFEEAGRR